MPPRKSPPKPKKPNTGAQKRKAPVKAKTKATGEGIAPTVMVSGETRGTSSNGRPTSFTDEKATAICTWIAQGKSLRAYCEQENTPDVATVYRWLAAHESFRDQYARAREDQADSMADEIAYIADTEPDPNKARVRIDARKWVASKLKPKKYGDKIGISGDGDGGPIQTEVIDRPEKETREEWIARRSRELGGIATLGAAARPSN